MKMKSWFFHVFVVVLPEYVFCWSVYVLLEVFQFWQLSFPVILSWFMTITMQIGIYF